MAKHFIPCTEVLIRWPTRELPSFTKGKAQLSAKEVQESRELDVVRIHVERLIGVIKQNYLVLRHSLQYHFPRGALFILTHL